MFPELSSRLEALAKEEEGGEHSEQSAAALEPGGRPAYSAVNTYAMLAFGMVAVTAPALVLKAIFL